jgi:hypothetical protein
MHGNNGVTEATNFEFIENLSKGSKDFHVSSSSLLNKVVFEMN